MAVKVYEEDPPVFKFPLTSNTKLSVKQFQQNENANRGCVFCDAGIPQSIHNQAKRTITPP